MSRSTRPPRLSNLFTTSSLMKLILKKDIAKTISYVKNNDIDLDYQNEQGFTALMLAVILSLESIVELLLDYGADYKIVNKKSMTVIHLAAKYSTHLMLKLLLRYNAFENDSLINPLFCAVSSNHVFFNCAELLKNGFDVNCKNVLKMDLLSYMISNNIPIDISLIKLFDKYKFNFKVTADNGENLAMIAAYYNKPELMLTFFQLCGDGIDNSDNTLLHYLFLKARQLIQNPNNFEIIDILSDNIDCNALNSRNLVALQYAIICCQSLYDVELIDVIASKTDLLEILPLLNSVPYIKNSILRRYVCDILLKHGVNPYLKSQCECNALHKFVNLCEDMNDYENIKILLRYVGKNINDLAHGNNVLFHLFDSNASPVLKIKIAKKLIEYGSNPNVLCNGKNILMFVLGKSVFEDLSVIKFLIRIVDVNQQDSDGYTALHYACSIKDEILQFEIISSLLNSNANLNIFSHKRKVTVLSHYIAENNLHTYTTKKTIELMLKFGANPHLKNNCNEDSFGYYVYACCEMGFNEDIGKMLLSYDMNMNKKNLHGDGYMYIIVMNSNLEKVRGLILMLYNNDYDFYAETAEELTIMQFLMANSDDKLLMQYIIFLKELGIKTRKYKTRLN